MDAGERGRGITAVEWLAGFLLAGSVAAIAEHTAAWWIAGTAAVLALVSLGGALGAWVTYRARR